jgi:hypothetical protein
LGSHHKKKKKTPSINVIVTDIKRDQDQDATRTAIQPSFEGITYMPSIRSMIDFVNVTETMDSSQTGYVITPSFWLALNNNLTESSASGFSGTISQTGLTYGTPGQFGSHYAILNSAGETTDIIQVSDLGTNTTLSMSTGFSFSFWIRPVDVSALANDRHILDVETAQNDCFLWLNSAAHLGVRVFENGVQTLTKVHQTVLTNNIWYHVAITFDGIADVLRLYVDKVIDTGVVTPTPASGPTTTRFDVGLLNGIANTYYEGHVDEIQYFKNGVLSQTNVNNLFATNAP